MKTDEEIAELKKSRSGFGSWDACHTRHTFSVAEARDPQTYATCHMGFDHPHREMHSTSKHGECAKMVTVCSECHSENFALGELEKGDKMIREVDRLLTEAIRIVASLYEDGILVQPAGYSYAFPDLLTFHDAPTPIETRLFKMHLKHRMRAFQGVFHANPDYALW